VDQKIEAHDLAKEIRETASRVEYRIKFNVTQDPEDFVVLRGSVEALIEMAEELA
jgi:hypothetical protein